MRNFMQIVIDTKTSSWSAAIELHRLFFYSLSLAHFFYIYTKKSKFYFFSLSHIIIVVIMPMLRCKRKNYLIFRNRFYSQLSVILVEQTSVTFSRLIFMDLSVYLKMKIFFSSLLQELLLQVIIFVTHLCRRRRVWWNISRYIISSSFFSTYSSFSHFFFCRLLFSRIWKKNSKLARRKEKKLLILFKFFVFFCIFFWKTFLLISNLFEVIGSGVELKEQKTKQNYYKIFSFSSTKKSTKKFLFLSQASHQKKRKRLLRKKEGK